MITRGFSREGLPIVYIRIAKDNLKDHDLNAQCFIYSIERAIQSITLHNTAVCHAKSMQQQNKRNNSNNNNNMDDDSSGSINTSSNNNNDDNNNNTESNIYNNNSKLHTNNTTANNNNNINGDNNNKVTHSNTNIINSNSNFNFNEEYMLIADCKDMSYNDIPSVSSLSNMASICAKHFPRRLGKVYIINAGFLVNILYSLCSVYMTDVTKKKIKFVSANESIDTLREILCK